MVGRRDAHPAHKKTRSTNPQRFSGTGGGGRPEREPADPPGKKRSRGGSSIRGKLHVCVWHLLKKMFRNDSGCVLQNVEI